MAGEALANGTIMEVETAVAATFIAVGGIVGSLAFPGPERGEIDVTALDSTGKEYIGDLPEFGDTSFQLQLRRRSPSGFATAQERLETLATSGAVVQFRFLLPPAFGAVTYTVSGFVKMFRVSAPVGDSIKAEVAIKFSGAAVRS